MLSDDERENYQRLRLPEHKQEYLVSHVLLRTVLARYLSIAPASIEFCVDGHGKPSLDKKHSQGLRFNLSHTSGMAVCAVAKDTDLGVDIERHSDSAALVDMADHYFSESEVAYLTSLPKPQQIEAFFDFWTLKEAYIKARGKGVVEPLGSFTFGLEGINGVPVFHTEAGIDSKSWGFRLFKSVDDYTIALAANHSIERAQLYHMLPGDNCEPIEECA
jgi:4'-phosphopantetheinyl transferase